VDAATSGGATMAKYKSKSQPPSFLSSFCPPASFIFLFRLFCDLRHRRRCFVVLVAGALYPRISLAAFSSWPPSRFLSLYAALVSRASVFRFNSPYASLFSDHFGFHPRTSRSDKIMGDELNKKWNKKKFSLALLIFIIFVFVPADAFYIFLYLHFYISYLIFILLYKKEFWNL